MFSHKISLKKFKKVEIIPSIFWDHNSIKLEVNYKKKAAKNTNTRRLNYMLLNNQWVKEEIKEQVKNPLKRVKIETHLSNIYETEKQS